MKIQTAKYMDEEQTSVQVNGTMSVPVSQDNRHWREVQEWVDEGNTIEAYQGPTLEEKRNEASLPRAEFMLTLKNAGIYLEAKRYAKLLPEDHDWRILWENAQVFHRMNENLITGARELGITDNQLDQLFGVE